MNHSTFSPWTLNRAALLCAACTAFTSAPAQTSAPAALAAPASEVVSLQAFETSAAKALGFGESRSTFTLDAGHLREFTPGVDITTALAQIPGVQVSTGDTRGGSFSFEIYLRGLGKDQIGFSVDGIPTGDARFNGGQPPTRFLDTGNVHEIVVSKSSGEIGSPSRFALGGFINFVTEDPAAQKGALLELGYGSFDFRRASLRVDTGDLGGGVSAYVSYSHKENEMFTGRDSRSSERDHVEAKIVKTFAAGSKLTFRTSFNDLADNDFNIVTLPEFQAQPDSDRALDAITGIPAQDVNFGGALGGLRKDWLTYLRGEFVLTEAIAWTVSPYLHALEGESYRYQDRSRRLTGNDPRAVTSYNALGGAVRPAVITTRNSNAVGGPADMRVTPRDRDRYGITTELKASLAEGRHEIRLGGWWESNEATEFRNFYPLLDSANSIAYDRADLAYVEYERTSDESTTMVYLQDRMSFLDEKLKIDVGVVVLDVGYGVKSPLEYSTTVDFSQSSDALPKLGASYRVSDKFEIFGGAARNFSGIPEDVFVGSSAVISEGQLDPVQSDNFDLGVRYGTSDFAVSLQGYYVELDNNIGIVPIPAGSAADVDDIIRGNSATRAANLSGITTKGIEVTLFKDIGPIDFYGSYAYQQAEHNDARSPAEAVGLAQNGIIGGATVRDIPEHSAYGRLGWTILEGLRVSSTASYVGERVGGHIIAPTFANPSNSFDAAGNPVSANQPIGTQMLSSYTLFGLNLQYQPRTGTFWDRCSFLLTVDNVFDKDYIGAVSSATATQPEYGVVGGAGYTLDRYFIGAPRTVTFTVSTRF